MKKLRILMIVSAFIFINITSIKAQVGISMNIGSQPPWGPVSYDYVKYYYLPEYDIYYYAPGQQFVYQNGSNWVYVNSLPNKYHNVNLYRTYKVVINELKPYLRHDYYVENYKKYKNLHSKQECICDSKDAKYERGNKHPDISTNVKNSNKAIGKIHHADEKIGMIVVQQKSKKVNKSNQENKNN